MMAKISEDRYRSASTFRQYLRTVEKNRQLWNALYERARPPEGLVDRVEAMEGRYRLLALSEDWCGDAVNLLPVVARLAEEAGNLDELRVLGRDANPDLMEAHLTDGSRSIPVVMVLDDQLHECGWWGPRPRELQKWVVEEGLEMPSGERYKRIRRWYARDRGRTALEEIADLMTGCLARV